MFGALLLIGPWCFGQTRMLVYEDLLKEKLYHTMEEALKQPEDVIRLRLENVKDVPKDLVKLKNLQWLDMSGGKLKELPKSMAKLEMLQVLHLYGNPMINFPKVVIKMKPLKVLNMNSCRLISIPEGISGMKKLEELYLAKNNLKGLPKDFGKLPVLKKLKINHNRFVTILPVEALGIKGLKHLEIDFKQNTGRQMAKLGRSFGQLESLTLYGDGASRVPLEITSFTKLVSLDLIKMADYFEWGISFQMISALSELKRLSITDSQIEQLDPMIGKIDQLRELTLWNNLIQTFPEEFYNGLLKLRKLNLEGNPITEEEKTKLKTWFRVAKVEFGE